MRAKIKKNNSGAKRLITFMYIFNLFITGHTVSMERPTGECSVGGKSGLL